MIRYALPVLLFTLLPLTGCSNPADDAATSSDMDVPATGLAPIAEADPVDAAAVETPEADTAPEVAMPEGLPAIVHIYPDLTITEANVVNAEQNQFEIKGETRSSVVQVLNYYAKYFPENGWEEDMLMEQPGNTVISFHKDGVLQYVESNEGGPGAYVTITTGNH